MNGSGEENGSVDNGSRRDSVEIIDIGIEKKFAEALGFNNEADAFEMIRQFRDICSTKALQVKDQLVESPEDIVVQEEFESWQLETKLWHLVEILYSYRLGSIDVDKVETWTSMAIQEENFRKTNTKVAELGMIIDWIQYNSESIDTSNVPWVTKWKNTIKKFETKDFNKLLNQQENSDDSYITEFDIDAPIRLGKRVHPDDEKIDDETFKTIYELILTHNYDDALQIANETGNYTLSMILVGDMLPYLDPIIDKEYMTNRGLKFDGAIGCKHKLLWYKTVYKLSQQRNINKYERMIYNYLSGSSIKENLSDTKSWDKWLLLYCNQEMVYEIMKFYESINDSNEEENISSIKIIQPETNNIEDILNILSRSDYKISEASRHPIRIMTGALMINKVSPLISDVIKSKSNSPVYKNQSLLRILVHLAIFLKAVEIEPIDDDKFTTLLKMYVSKLSENQLYDIVPNYIAYIPNDEDAGDCYSDFIRSLDDKHDRATQIKVAKSLTYFNDAIDSDTHQDRLSIFLRKAVSRIIKDTESHYKPSTKLRINIDTDDESDRTLYESIDLFIANNMYEDIILASIVIIKRFLLCGKLVALTEFAQDKNFKQIINNYDNEVNTRNLLDDKEIVQISEEEKEELLNYESFIKGLISINEWKKFIEDNKTEVKVFKTKDVENSLEKTTKQIYGLIMQWLVNSNDLILKELRNLYVPYLIIELLQIYEFARYNNWEYMQKAFDLMKQVANEDENDLLNCFINSGRLKDFLNTCGQVSLVASERGINGIFI